MAMDIQLHVEQAPPESIGLAFRNLGLGSVPEGPNVITDDFEDGDLTVLSVPPDVVPVSVLGTLGRFPHVPASLRWAMCRAKVAASFAALRRSGEL